MPTSEIAIVVEAYNETEHSSVDRLALALEAAEHAGTEHGGARVVLADLGGNQRVVELIESRFPGVQRVQSPVPDYEIAKTEAARAADSKIVVFLDGDCQPGEGWLPALLAPIVAGDAVATAGFTSYEGGWFSRVLTVMDFGFLMPRRPRSVGCYASNNAAFLAKALFRTPIPGGDMRSRCFAHAQRFERQGEPMQLTPSASVRHEKVPLVAERLRRGWDLVTAVRVDPELPEARWLHRGVRAAPLFWYDAVRLDVQRLMSSGEDVGLRGLSKLLAIPIMLGLRCIDFVGIVAALRGRPVPLS